MNALIIPRALFFQSELYHRLNGTDGLTAGPILENLKAVWRDPGRTNEDAVHLVLNAGSLLYADWSALVDLARRDLGGALVAIPVSVSAYLPLLGLPRAALAAVPYAPLTISPSYSYTCASGGSPKAPRFGNPYGRAPGRSL